MLLQPESGSESSLDNYFRERLAEVSETLNPPPQEDTLWYVGNLLTRFSDSDQLFGYEDGQRSLRPLALLYGDARDADSKRERCLILRHLGDLSLFLGALFPENYSRRGIGKDYFVGMGGGAYDYLSENAASHRHVFSELATGFARMLQLIARACSRQHIFDAGDVLELYQRWRHSKDPLAGEQLQAIGITLDDSDYLQ